MAFKPLLPRSGSLIEFVWPLSILFAVWVWFYAPVILMQSRIDWDAYALTYPTLLFLSDSFHSGIFPFWNPFTMSGDAFLGQCAAFAYHPIIVFAALMPQNWNLYYVFEMLLLLTALSGGIGAYLYLQFLVGNKIAAVTGAAVFMTAAFMALLGQPAVACSIASLPWLLLCVEWILSTPARIDPVKTVVLALVLGFSFISSYFGTFLYNIIMFGLYALFRSLEIKRSGADIALGKVAISFCAAGSAALLLAAPYLLAGMENRAFLYKELAGDFISPDLRLRGMALPLKDVVNILRGWEDVFHVLLSSPRFHERIPKWVFGVGYFYLLLYAGSFFISKKPKLMSFFNFAAVVSSIYVIGKHGFVYKFLYNYVPVLGNIRYPVFAFYILQFSLIVCGTIALARFMAVLDPKKRYAALICCGLIALLIGDLSLSARGLRSFEGHIYTATDPDQLRSLAMQDRVKSVIVADPKRFMSKTAEFDFADTKWVTQKVMFNHGYSTYDSPYYWYLKNMDFLKDVFSVPARVVPTPGLTRAGQPTDNAYIEALAAAVAAAGRTNSVIVDRIPAGFSQEADSCRILSTQASPNLFKAHVYAAKDCFVSLYDKFYPGWRVSVNGSDTGIVKTNFLFKGVYLKPGNNMIEFSFVPVGFYVGVLISAVTLISSILVLVLGIRRRSEFI